MAKNIWTCLFLTVLLLTACHGNSFKIKGSVEGIDNGDTLYATTDFQNGIPFDTMVVKDGKFSMSGRADSVRQCIIYCAQDEAISSLLFLEPGQIKVELSLVPERTKVSGTALNDAWQSLNDSVNIFSNQVNNLLAQYYTEETSQEEKTKILSKITTHAQKINQCICKTAEKNINNELGYFLILDGSMAEEDRLRLIGQLPNEMRERKGMKALLDHLASGTEENDFLDPIDGIIGAADNDNASLTGEGL